MEQASAPPAVELRYISKVFGTNRALDQVDLTINQGEVLGLLGQNGSGKSTLVKILSGVYDPEPGGTLKVGGEDVPLPLPPGQASEIGLSFVYQNLALAPGLTVLENLTLGQRVTTKRGFKFINWVEASTRRPGSASIATWSTSTWTRRRASWRRSTRPGWPSSGPRRTCAATGSGPAARTRCWYSTSPPCSCPKKRSTGSST